MNTVNFSTYVANAGKEYIFTIKLACDELPENCVFKLEESLTKYGVKSVKNFKETPIQMNPLDFPNVKNSKVFIGEVVLQYPVTFSALALYISEQLNISQQAIAVYSENHPGQTLTKEFLDRKSPEFKKDYVPVIGNEQEWPKEAKYGDEFITEFLKDLDSARKERTGINVYDDQPLSPKQKIDTKTMSAKSEPAPAKSDGIFTKDLRVPKK